MSGTCDGTTAAIAPVMETSIAIVIAVPSYYTVRIPWSAVQTQWHPTERQGAWSVVCRGAFQTEAEAVAWGVEHLCAQPFTVVACYDVVEL